MTTTTITWHKPANYPDADVRVLIAFNRQVEAYRHQLANVQAGPAAE